MGRTLTRVISSMLVCSFVLAGAGSAHAALTDGERADRAASYIASQQKPNGAIVAFSAIGSTPSRDKSQMP